ncbi:hypothetical protein HPP92_015886 [Vanilla planifolia]|uniref:[RNA-polymerase]-subunit kinase n=1 Tax=Vanilla planifolia TaxID=51239 RepID=A0A835QQA8_VANPL|nr:hypothetical protein HPP92_015886 [Vanilla planifolia]
MGCVVSKKSKKSSPRTPILASGGVSGSLGESGGILNPELWNRIEISESGESGKLSSNGTDSQSFRLGNFHRHVEGEMAAAGWPSWLSAIAREAIQGWIPLKAESFEKLEKIGQGTYSSVFKARDLETGKIVALKKVRFDNFEPESVRFMAREIFILRRLNHPNIVKLEGLVTSKLSHSIYLVFEYMEHDLAGLSSSPDIRFSESQVKCYMSQLLSGLEHCHSRGILHRDIKCANLLLNNDGILKIADFGATEYEPTVDMWSVGCVFAELFLKRPVLQGKTEVEQIHKIFKLCGSPPEEYWRKSKLPHETLFKPQQAYQSCLRETFRCLPESAYKLLVTFLSIEPQKRGTATAALSSEYFRTMPYACDHSSLPRYPPNKEIDAKNREESLKRKFGGIMHPLEAERRHSRSNISLRSSFSSKLSSLEEPWLKAEGTTRGGGKQKSARVNDEAGLFVDMQLKAAIHAEKEDWLAKPTSGVDRLLPVPMAYDASIGSTRARKQREVQTSVRSQSKCSSKGDAYGFQTHGDKPSELEKTLMVHQWVQLGHPEPYNEFDCQSRNSIDMHCNMDVLPSKHFDVGYKKHDDRVEFSAPLLYQSGKVNELLEKHEQQMRQAIRHSWFQKGNRK